jgi:uncharacterized GH25 family protein
MKTWLLLATIPTVALAAERVTAAGRVVDSSGQPVPGAQVLVYSAGMKKGYALYCPTCFPDCGKRATTGADGRFSIERLNAELTFTLLVVKNRYSTEFMYNADPASGELTPTTLKARPEVKDKAQVFLGKVVNAEGRPLRDVLVEPSAVILDDPSRGGPIGTFGARDWIDAAAVSDEKGEFEIAYSKPALEMTLTVFARGMAAKRVIGAPGEGRKQITVTDGATVRGRFVYQGKPVASAQVALGVNMQLASMWMPELTVGTQDDGTFVATNVPAGRLWKVYPKMDSVADRNIGLRDPVVFAVKDDGQEIDLGDIELKPTYTLRGRVILTDGKPFPPYMNVTVGADGRSDGHMALISADGSFTVKGLPPGAYNLAAGVRGYRLAGECHFCSNTEVLVNGDVSGFTIRLQPER